MGLRSLGLELTYFEIIEEGVTPKRNVSGHKPKTEPGGLHRERNVATGHEEPTGTESRNWACGRSKVPRQRHDWETVVNPGREKATTRQGGPEGNKASQSSLLKKMNRK